MSTNLLCMFPGQGSQFVGMGKDLLEQFPAQKATFEEAEDATKVGLRRLCLEGPESDLTLTANTQPCILTVSTAIWRVLQKECEVKPDLFAGHSLGEYSALVAAGRLDLTTAARLVRKRGEAMQEAVPVGVGAMAAVLNHPAEELEKLCKELSKPDDFVAIANYNSAAQLVVAGHKKAVDELCKKLETLSVRFVVLQVSAPFHSKLMKKAREVMAPLLKDANFHSKNTKMIANLTGKVESGYNADFLIEQIDNPVRWTQTMETAVAAECKTYLEVGPGKVLYGLARRAVPKESKLIDTTDIRKAIQALTSTSPAS
jgi:[acyl-carrier-protein] S-malonyltransferase